MNPKQSDEEKQFLKDCEDLRLDIEELNEPLMLSCLTKTLYIDKNKSYGEGLKTPRYSSVAIKPTSDIRYKSNGQLFASIEDIEGFIIKPEGNLYYEDGSVLYSEELDESGQYNSITIKRPNGEYDLLLNAIILEFKLK